MVPPSLRLVVDWIHIREAERRGRDVTPLALALVEQSRFRAGRILPDAVVLTDDLTGAQVRYAPHPALAEFQRRFAQGEAVEPVAFVLEQLPDQQ